MKRIIEIPDKIVEAIQNGEDYRYDIHTAIAQSKPYDDSGDLISRKDLQEKHNESCAGDCACCAYGVDYTKSSDSKFHCLLIDNAQAVDLWQMRQEATENALKKAREADRWIPVSEKLPEPLISVIATDNNDRFVAWYNEGWKSSDSQFDKHTPIVAWRPIPQYTESVDV